MQTLVDALRSVWTLRLVRRTASRSHPIDAVAAVCAASRAYSPATAFAAILDEQERAVPLEPTEANLRAHIGNEPSASLTLAGVGDHPPALGYHRDPLRSPSEDLVEILVRAGSMTPERLWRWLSVAASAYGAELAWLDTYDLRVFADESRRRAAEQATDPELRPFVPGPGPLITAHPVLADRFARAAVPGPGSLPGPKMVYWANVWPRSVLERLGRERIERAPWHLVEPAGDGLLLVATADPPDREHPDALAAIASILEELQLPGSSPA
jgi:hypothetical protein